MNLIKIENTINIKGNDLQVVEYKGVRVLSSYDIARLHGKEVKAVNQQFERNKERLKEGVDYFLINREELLKSQAVTLPPNLREIKLFTEKGYLKLVKSFTDDLSWEVQDLLVDSYFELQQALSPKSNYQLGIINASTEIDRMVALNEYEIGYVRPLEQFKEQAQPKVTYHDLVLKSEDLILISQIAKDFGLTAQKLNKILHEEGIQYKDKSGVWLLYAEHLDKNYAQTVTNAYEVNGKTHTKLHLKWTQTGRLFIYELLKSKGILPVVEKEAK